MNILFIVPYVPNLIRMRSYNLIRKLAENGHKITLATLWSSEREKADLEALEPYCVDFLTYRLPRWRPMLNCLLALPTTEPLQAAYCWSPDLAQAILREVEGRQADHARAYDVVHVEHLRGVRYGLALKQAKVDRPVPTVWDSVDSISYLFRQAAQYNPRWLMRALFGFELHRTERFEARMLSLFQQIMVTSQVDRQAFLNLNPAGSASDCLSVLNNGVDLAYFQPGSVAQRDEKTVVVTGKMSYHANVNMVMRLINEIMPVVWKEEPAVKVLVVGKDPPKTIQELAQDGRITVTGTVPDLRPYLHKATVAIAPLSYGAGIQNKVLEAMACATPVVSSLKSVAALEHIQVGHDLLAAEDSTGLARQLVAVVRDRQLQESLSQAGRKYVEAHHDWNQIVKRLEMIYQKTIFG